MLYILMYMGFVYYMIGLIWGEVFALYIMLIIIEGYPAFYLIIKESMKYAIFQDIIPYYDQKK